MNSSVPPPGAPGHASGTQTPPTEDGLDRFFRTLRTIGLHRSNDERWVGGVCGGLAERLRVDPLIIRATFILLGLVFGAGVTLYLIAWVLLPDRSGVILLQKAMRGGDAAAIVLVIVVACIAVSGFGLFWGWGGPGPIVPVLLLVGVLIYLMGKQNRTEADAAPAPAPTGWQGTPDSPSAPTPATAQPGTPQTGTTEAAAAAPGSESRAVVPYAHSLAHPAPGQTAEPASYTATSVGGAAPYVGDSTSDPTGGSTPPGVPPTAGIPEWVPPPPGPKRRKIGSGGTLVVLGLAAIIGSATAMVANATDLADVSVRLGIAAAAATVGLGVVIAGIVGRRAGFASFVGLVLALVTAVGAAIPKDFSLEGPHGEQTWRPSTVADATYRMGGGEGRLDLRRLTPDTDATETATVKTRVAVGELRIIVPDDLSVRIRAHVDGGNITADPRLILSDSGDDVSGLNRSRTFTVGTDRPVLTVDADLGYGEISIERTP